ncbi:hypothetical protein GCM10022406_21090 [Hymenobacter algoricola]|uniref:Outer membrane protein beta-barrel domain-containing protein n=1 Tax=Hymenobacter algoricola TaxID=486267 RepID=A0ABP7N7M6_9BACT
MSVPGSLQIVTLTVSSIGYETVQRQVEVGDSVFFGLSVSYKTLCDLTINPSWKAGLSSGVRYAPLGASIHFLGSHHIPSSLKLHVDYQTNLRQNHAFIAGVELPPLLRHNQFTITEQVSYQQFQAAPAKLQFRAYSATVGLGVYRIGSVRVPDLLVGAGHSRYQTLQRPEAAAETGYGYIVGLRRSFGYPLRALVLVQATRWPDFWQLQGSASRAVFGKFSAGVSYQQLRRYQEVSLTLSRYFY